MIFFMNEAIIVILLTNNIRILIVSLILIKNLRLILLALRTICNILRNAL